MSKRDTNDVAITETIVRDPVGYLAAFGIEAEVVTETTFPAAA